MRALRYSLVAFAVIAALAVSVALVMRAMQSATPPPQSVTPSPTQNPPSPPAQEDGIATSESPAPAMPVPGQNTMSGRIFDPLVLPPAGKNGPDAGSKIGAGQPGGGELAGARLNLSAEQQEKIRYVLLSHNIVQSDTAGFTLQIGGVVPQNVPLTPLPHEVADAVPNYRAYSYVIAQDRIAIVANGRREIGFLISL